MWSLIFEPSNTKREAEERLGQSKKDVVCERDSVGRWREAESVGVKVSCDGVGVIE